MARKSRFTEEQRRWWQNELTKYYQKLNDNTEVDPSDELWSWLDEWVRNYDTYVIDCKAKIIERFGPRS